MSRIFKPVKTGTVSARVADEIRRAIFAGKLSPGESLLELHLARDLQVSQTSVREALFQLERVGLVRRIRNHGTFVTELAPDDIRDLLEIRMPLEEVAAARAAQRADPERLRMFEHPFKSLCDAVEHNSYFESSQADLEFHRTVWRLSGNKALAVLLDEVCAPMFAFQSILRSRRLPDLKHLVDLHKELLTALRSGDPERSRTTMRDHLAESYESFLFPPPLVSPSSNVSLFRKRNTRPAHTASAEARV